MSIKVNKFLTDAETCCNILDSIPAVGIASSTLRIGAGKFQFFAGVMFASVGLIGSMCGNNKKAWQKVIRQGGDHLLHGALNIIRGIGTLLLASAGLNIILLPWQLIRDERFAPVVPYGQRFKSHNNVPAAPQRSTVYA